MLKDCIFILLILSFIISSSEAEQIWLKPSRYHSITGAQKNIYIMQSGHFTSQKLPYSRKHIKSFALSDSKSQRRIKGRRGKTPAGIIRIIKSGSYALSCQFRTKKVRGVNYTHCAKSIVASGKWQQFSNISTAYNRSTRLPLEFIAQKNPYEFKGKGKFPIQLVYNNKALSNIAVTAIDINKVKKVFTVKTNQQGMIYLPLTKGVWLIQATYTANKHSFSTSLTFEIMALDPYKDIKLPAILLSKK